MNHQLRKIRRFLLPLTVLIVLLTFLLPTRTLIFAQGTQDRWAGVVSDENGLPLAATITINGQQGQAAADGSFELDVPSADDDRYVINAEMFGYVPVSKIHVGTAIEALNLTLKQPQRFEIDPEQEVSVEDGRGTQISIPANSLVDANENPATGTLQLLIHTYDLTQEAMPGDMSALDSEGQPVALQSAGVFYAQFTDAEGNEYNLAPQTQAEISIPVDPDLSLNTIPLWSYDETQGLWVEEGEATQAAGRYTGPVSHFSVWNFDIEMREPACIKLTVDREFLPTQVKAVVKSPYYGVTTLNLTQETNVLYNLPANAKVNFYMPPSSPTPFASVNTGAPWGGTSTPPHPYDDCNGMLDIEEPEPSAVHGMKYHDLNGNGVKDAGEPGLEEWTISLKDANGNLLTTTTDANGNYQFTNLPAGTTSVAEGQQPGWVQTSPPTVKHTLVLTPGAELENMDFGNTEPCENPTTERCEAGRQDNFGTSDGSEPSTPSQDLLDWAQGRTILTNFDVIPTNRFFIHTFGESDTDTCLSGDCLIVGAKLTIRLKAGPSSLAWNDTIGFVQNGVAVWTQRIHNLVPGGTWSPGQVATITLDLANLPGVTNVLAALQDGDLDFYIEDDTGIDFAELEVEKCCDCTPPPPDMVAWWHFDEPTGPTAADIAMYPNDGTHINNPTPIVGVVDGALSFAGTQQADQYVEVPHHDEIDFDTGDLSIDAWIRTDSNKNLEIFIDKRENRLNIGPVGYAFHLENGRLAFQLADDSNSWYNYWNSTGPDLRDGKWHFIAVTVDRDQPIDGLKLYIDGPLIEAFSPMNRTGSISNNADLWIGKHHANSAFNRELWFDGDLDEVEIFNRVLDPTEIQAIYEAGSAGKCKCEEKDVMLEAGVEDDFSTSNGTESPSPSVGLQSLYGSSRDFDTPQPNKRFLHTFSDLLPEINTSEICSATLEIRVKPGPGGSFNDSMALMFVDSGGNRLAVPWGRYFGSGNSKDGLFSFPWYASAPAQTITLDLDALPQDGGGTVSILGYLNHFGFLDVEIQDDTAVDYVKLKLHYCCDKAERADLAIDKSHVGHFEHGGVGTYAIDVTNVDTVPAHGPVIVNDILPTGATYLSGGGSGWTCLPGVTCTYTGLPALPLAPGQSLPPLVINARLSDVAELKNCAQVEAYGDHNPANDESCDVVELIEPINAPDFGDAPDSTNHSGNPMLAYWWWPPAPARYPTVHGLGSGWPPGPMHIQPEDDAFLGLAVSQEKDADQLLDQDGITNIAPPSNWPNRDWYDDGVHLNTVNLPRCGQTSFQYDVNVVGSVGNRTLNVWIDYNQDGDWNDWVPCRRRFGPWWWTIWVPEWSVQNHTVNLTPGYHTNLDTPYFSAKGPTNWSSRVKGMWMRTTLTQTPVPWPASFDGRGPIGGYEYGETEDYHLRFRWWWVRPRPDVAVSTTFTQTNGLVDELAIPAPAVTEPMTVTIAPVSSEGVAAGQLIQRRFDMDAYSEDGELAENFTFEEPVNLTLHYTDEERADEGRQSASSLVLLRNDTQTGEWVEAACGEVVDDTDANSLSVPVCQTGEFALASGAPTGVSISAPVLTEQAAGSHVSLPITIAPYADGNQIEAYDFTLMYDPSVISITGVSQADTLSEEWSVTSDSTTPGQLVITANGDSTLADGGGTLINLTTNLTTTTTGVTTTLTFGQATVNDGDLSVIPQPGILAIKEVKVDPPKEHILYLPLVAKP
ncbi:MAG: LamG-like jellyroll fold domain-containing protein [Ardenticatenaceae bacterium]